MAASFSRVIFYDEVPAPCPLVKPAYTRMQNNIQIYKEMHVRREHNKSKKTNMEL